MIYKVFTCVGVLQPSLSVLALIINSGVRSPWSQEQQTHRHILLKVDSFTSKVFLLEFPFHKHMDLQDPGHFLPGHHNSLLSFSGQLATTDITCPDTKRTVPQFSQSIFRPGPGKDSRWCMLVLDFQSLLINRDLKKAMCVCMFIYVIRDQLFNSLGLELQTSVNHTTCVLGFKFYSSW